MITLILGNRTPDAMPILDEVSNMLNLFRFNASDRKERIEIHCCDKACHQIVKQAKVLDITHWRRYLLQAHQIHPERPIVFRNKVTKAVAFEAVWRRN